MVFRGEPNVLLPAIRDWFFGLLSVTPRGDWQGSDNDLFGNSQLLARPVGKTQLTDASFFPKEKTNGNGASRGGFKSTEGVRAAFNTAPGARSLRAQVDATGFIRIGEEEISMRTSN
ncbi:hypothetical protein K0M31_015421 [Melipona bicolor]|uniref:Uncharacterized protein n=1 Tax=Melipona bicolor TaxID=60889 RepID=A0AA40FFF2_9HYME|nr:hypothetical protein K0M31_015421 [Melipona bicolor]